MSGGGRAPGRGWVEEGAVAELHAKGRQRKEERRQLSSARRWDEACMIAESMEAGQAWLGVRRTKVGDGRWIGVGR